MGRPRATLGILIALLAAGPLQAQQRTCRQVLESTFHRIVNTRGEAIVYFRDPVRVFCTGGVRLEADSAVLNQQAQTVELVGNVVYQDSVRRLEADWANYLGGMDQLLARGNAVIEDLEEGAVISGEQLNYLRETEERQEARLIVIGGRPHALLPARDSSTTTPDPGIGPPGRRRPGMAPPDQEVTPPFLEPSGDAAADSTAEPAPPTHVWANRLQMEGEVFRANGDVEMERGEMTGSGSLAVYDRVLNRMTLSGDARLSSDAYQLSGDRVVATLEEDALKELVSWGDARALSEELEIRSERIRIRFEGGEVRGMEAWNVSDEAPRVWARARDFELRADSLEAIGDSVGIRELHAIGRAYGQRVLPDTGAARAVVAVTQAEAEVTDSSAVIEPLDVDRDWVQGDTILGFFAQVRATADEAGGAGEGSPDEAAEPPPVPRDGATAADSVHTVLERLEVVGGADPALSLYRIVKEDDAGTGINFMKAKRIVLFMTEGDVSRVEAEGPIEGLYLEPRQGGQVSDEPVDGRATNAAA